MFIDARTLEESSVIEADICIIGGGAAGITLAREFANTRYQICVLESGGMQMDRATQTLQKIINKGRAYPKLQRLRPRAFGGATQIWGGHLVPLRAINFEAVPWIAQSGWPFGLEELLPYYNRAASLLGIDDYNYAFDAAALSASTSMPLFPFDRDVVESVISHYLSPSWNKAPSIGQLLYDEVKNAPNLTFYLHATVKKLHSSVNGAVLQHAECCTLEHNHISVRARYFILATGGIENARLLLLSDDVDKNGMGNRHDNIGRYFMDHINYLNGAIIPKCPQPVLGLYGNVVKHNSNRYSRCHIALPEAQIRQHQIPDFRSEIIITDHIQPGWTQRKFDALQEWTLDFHLLDSKLAKLIRPFMAWDEPSGKPLPSGANTPVVYRLLNYVEQVPNPDSRITLCSQRDRLGQRKAAINWKISEIDREGVRVAHKLIADEVTRSGFGEMVRQLPEDEPIIMQGAKGGAHHMGTTRMHTDPKNGVVDANCRVHGMSNFYIAGSSVFPTGGYANPTFTILAMTVRLADHLKIAISAA